MNSMGILMVLCLIFIIFVIAMFIIFHYKRKEEREILIKEILISNPNDAVFLSIKHLGQEGFDGWIWHDKKVKELSYKELINIYNIIYYN